MAATTVNAWWLRRISRRDFETFFLGTAMIVLAQKKRQPNAATEWRVLIQKPTRWQVKHALAGLQPAPAVVCFVQYGERVNGGLGLLLRVRVRAELHGNRGSGGSGVRIQGQRELL